MRVRQMFFNVGDILFNVAIEDNPPNNGAREIDIETAARAAMKHARAVAADAAQSLTLDDFIHMAKTNYKIVHT